jgi:hypothetical protein
VVFFFFQPRRRPVKTFPGRQPPRKTDRQLRAEFERLVTRTAEGHWLWSPQGNGLFRHRVSKSGRCYRVSALLFAYRHYRGHLPRGCTAVVGCGVGGCVNPQHLRLVPLHPRD